MFFLCGGVDKAYVWGLSALRWPHIAHLSPLGQMQVAIRQALELDHQEGCGIVADRGPWSVGSIVLIGLHIQILPLPRYARLGMSLGFESGWSSQGRARALLRASKYLYTFHKHST
jgi:hypothetical protein